MSDLSDTLDQIRERAEKASAGPWEADGSLIKSRGRAISQTWGVWWRNDLSLIAHARTDVPRLVAAVEAVHNLIEKYPVPHKRDDPTGEIASAIEGLGDAVLEVLADKLEGEDDG